jgi:hypothetical protein
MASSTPTPGAGHEAVGDRPLTTGSTSCALPAPTTPVYPWRSAMWKYPAAISARYDGGYLSP